MPIQVACGDCNKRYRFPDERAGETVECKECGADIEIPGVRRAGAKKKKKKQKSNAPIIPLALGGIAALVAGIAAFLFMKGGQPAQPNLPPADNGQQVAANSVTPPAANSTPTNNPSPATSTPPAVSPSAASMVPAAAANPQSAVASGFKNAKSTNGFKPIQNWTVTVDPSALALSQDGAKNFNVKTESDFIQGKLIVYPDLPSPLVLVGPKNFQSESREIWDLFSGKKVSVVKLPRFSGNDVGFSPDGAYIAWFRIQTGGNGIEVYDVNAKKTLGVLPVDPQKFNVARVSLPTPNRIVATSNVNRGILCWKLPSGDFERQITLGDKGQPDPRFAFSPGGRFLAVVADYLTKAIDIFDLENGEKAGSIEFAGRGPDLSGMAFSRDGKQFAAAYADPFTEKAERIVFWNVADGAITDDFELSDPKQRKHDVMSSHSSFQWFPDGKRLLLNGQHVIDRESKGVVFSFPKPSLDFATSQTRRILTDTSIAAWEGTNKAAAISQLAVKSEDIARAKEVAATGGLMSDAKLPNLTPFDRTKAVNQSVINVDWKATTDPAPGEGKLTGSIPIKSVNGRLREMKFSRPDAGIIAIRVAEDEDTIQAAIHGLVPRFHLVNRKDHTITRFGVNPVPCLKNQIEVYDAGKQGTVSRIEINFPCELTAVSPDGTRVMVQAMNGNGRLDIFGADGQHVAGCRPFQDEDDVKKREIESAVFLDANTVAACSADDRMVAFRLPSCEPIYSIDDAGTPVVSPGGKFIATSAHKKVEFRDSQSGESRGLIELDADAQVMSFSPKGDRLAILTRLGNGDAVVIVDLSTGSTTSVPTPQATAPLVWCGENEVLAGVFSSANRTSAPNGVNVDRSLMLIDLKRRAVLWSYLFGIQDNVSFGNETFDGRFWTAGFSENGKKGQIKAVALPEPATAKLLTSKALDAQLIVKPGTSIAISFEVPDPPEVSGYPRQARAIVDEVIKNNQLTIKDNAPIRLVISLAPASVTGTITLKALGGAAGQKRPDSTAQRKGVTVRVAYEAGGKEVWGTKHDVTNDFFGVTRLADGMEPQAALDQQMWQRALKALAQTLPPPYVFSSESRSGFGVSRLTEAGIQPAGK